MIVFYCYKNNHLSSKCTRVCFSCGVGRVGCVNILVLRNAFEKTRNQMKVNALSINALGGNLNFPMFAKLTLKKT